MPNRGLEDMILVSDLGGSNSQLGLPTLPEEPPDASALFHTPQPGDDSDIIIPDAPTTSISSTTDAPDIAELVPSQTLKDLHNILLETTISSGKLVCGACGHEYAIKEGIANFLLPSHLV